MQHMKKTRSCLVAIALLGVLATLAERSEAGIVITKGSYKGIGDPDPYYAFDVTLQSGSTLLKGDTITIKDLIGADTNALTAVPLNSNNKQIWTTIFPNPVDQAPLIDNNINYGTFTAIDVRFKYTGSTISASSGDVSLGTFQVFEDTSLPALPGNSVIQNTYKFNIDGGASTGNGIVSFTVVPEPSSLVIVGLVGSCLIGVSLSRRRRREA